MSAPIQLLDLTAILQFGAGVSILFFYQEILTYVVPAKARENIIQEISKWKGQFHGVLTDKDINRLNKITVDPQLQSFKSTVTHLGKLSFILLLTLLFIAAHERQGVHYSYDCILISTFIFTAYSIIAILFIHHNFYRRTASFLWSAIPIATISAIATIYGIESSEQNLPGADYGSYYALSGFILVVLFAISKFYYDERIAKTLWAECERLKTGFEAFASWKVLPTEHNFLRIPTQIRRLYPRGHEITPENAQEKFDKFMADKIRHMLKSYPSISFQLHLFIKHQKSHFITAIPKIVGIITIICIAIIYAMAIWHKICS